MPKLEAKLERHGTLAIGGSGVGLDRPGLLVALEMGVCGLDLSINEAT